MQLDQLKVGMDKEMTRVPRPDRTALNKFFSFLIILILKQTAGLPSSSDTSEAESLLFEAIGNSTIAIYPRAPAIYFEFQATLKNEMKLNVHGEAGI